jgi:hypothetical protein
VRERLLQLILVVGRKRHKELLARFSPGRMLP